MCAELALILQLVDVPERFGGLCVSSSIWIQKVWWVFMPIMFQFLGKMPTCRKWCLSRPELYPAEWPHFNHRHTWKHSPKRSTSVVLGRILCFYLLKMILDGKCLLYQCTCIIAVHLHFRKCYVKMSVMMIVIAFETLEFCVSLFS